MRNDSIIGSEWFGAVMHRRDGKDIQPAVTRCREGRKTDHAGASLNQQVIKESTGYIIMLSIVRSLYRSSLNMVPVRASVHRYLLRISRPYIHCE